ncbi:MAG: cytochrome c [Gemmatimonadetes bacterium]|nr:cytochrome c [Gemmatimonadota bacterium]NIQ54706.1 cytochrome c [Gemmatimonadota bacterium]NIU74911.1 cytochrome c [Gammaproteobacteria bacterium]NIX44796.1 cytochrome c [Gemmatimonadota bacterium]NIY09032.1 cytochrome c [Gemmatimonadota bacterium]
MTRSSWAAALALTALAAGCGPGDDRDGDARETRRAPTAGPAAVDSAVADSGPAEAEAPPTLRGIMLQLQADMGRVSRGIWAGRFDSVAAAAQAIADHPRVGPRERTAIVETLGDRAAAFQAADAAVHDAAVVLAEQARAGDITGVMEALARLQDGCVACHTGFRDVLRADGGVDTTAARP